MYLVFDTETSGFKDPHIVQLGAILLNSCFKEVASISSLIKPTDWSIHPEAQKHHGISLEDCHAYGIPIQDAMPSFYSMCKLSINQVGFNTQFDIRVCDLELQRLYGIAHNWTPICLMKETTPICKLPHPTFNCYKKPKLSEAYRHFFGEELQQAHDALFDVRATARIFKHFKENYSPALAQN